MDPSKVVKGAGNKSTTPRIKVSIKSDRGLSPARGRGRSLSPGPGRGDSYSPGRGRRDSSSPGRGRGDSSSPVAESSQAFPKDDPFESPLLTKLELVSQYEMAKQSSSLEDRRKIGDPSKFREKYAQLPDGTKIEERYFDLIYGNLLVKDKLEKNADPSTFQQDYKTLSFKLNQQEQSGLPQLQTLLEGDQQGPPKGPATHNYSSFSGDSGPEKAIQANLAQSQGNTGEKSVTLQDPSVFLLGSGIGDQDPVSRAESAAQRAENAARRAEQAAGKALISAGESVNAVGYSTNLAYKATQQLETATSLVEYSTNFVTNESDKIQKLSISIDSAAKNTKLFKNDAEIAAQQATIKLHELIENGKNIPNEVEKQLKDFAVQQLEEYTLMLSVTETLQKQQIDRLESQVKQIQKKLLETQKYQTLSNMFKKELNLVSKKLGFVSHDSQGNILPGYRYTLDDFNKSVKDSQNGLGRYLIRLNVKQKPQPKDHVPETSTRTARDCETETDLINQLAYEIQEPSGYQPVETTPDPDPGRPAFNGPWERELSFSYSPPTFFPNQINRSRNRFSSDWALTVEKYKNKPWFFGIIWTSETLVAPNRYSPAVDETDGLAVQQRITARFGDNYSLSTVWWGRDDKTFTRVQLGYLWNDIFEVSGFESRLETGLGFMSPQTPIRIIPSLFNLENLKKGFFVHCGAEINTYFFVMVKRFAGRIILGFPQTTINKQIVRDQRDFYQEENGISEKLDQVLNILKKNTKNQEQLQKFFEILKNYQINENKSQQLKNNPSVNNEKERANLQRIKGENLYQEMEDNLYPQMESSISNNENFLKQQEKISSPKKFQNTVVQDNFELAKQVKKQIENNPLVVQHNQAIEEDYSKKLLIVSQLNKIKQETASQINEIKDLVLQNKIELLDELKRVGPEILNKIVCCDLNSSTDFQKLPCSDKNPLHNEEDFYVQLFQKVYMSLTFRALVEQLAVTSFIGVGGGFIYIILSQVVIRSENNVIKSTARVFRKTLSFAYPFALIIMVFNISSNLLIKKPLLNKWNSFSISEKIEKLPIWSSKSQLAGFIFLKGYNLLFFGFAGYSIFRLLRCSQVNPFLFAQLGVSYLIGYKTYSIYYYWVSNNQSDFEKQLKLLDYQDSIFNLFTINNPDIFHDIISFFKTIPCFFNNPQKTTYSYCLIDEMSI